MRRSHLPAAIAPAAVFAGACLLFAFGAEQRDLWRTDEYRYAEVARVMAAGEGSWLVPHLNGAIYVSKPPGFFWAAAVGHRSLGLSLQRAALLPSVLAGALSVALIFLLGRRGFGWRGGLLAASILGSAEMFASLALRANLDALLTACITSSLTLYWIALETLPMGEVRSPREVKSDREIGSGRRARSTVLLLAAGLCAGLGLLVKGPVALAVPAVVILAHRWLEGRPLGLGPRAFLGAVLMSLLPAAVWLSLAGLEAGTDYLGDLVLGNGVGHALGRVDKLRPFWFYLKTFPSGFLPWALFLPAALWAGSHSARDRAGRFALAWAVAPFLLFSAFPAKRHLYLLPLYPGAALLVARLLITEPSNDRVLRAFRNAGRGLLGLASMVVGIALSAAAGLAIAGFEETILSIWPLWEALSPSADGVIWTALLVGPCLAMAGGVLLATKSGSRQAQACLCLGVALSLFLVGVFHPLKSAGMTRQTFYGAVRDRVGDAPVAAYGPMDFSANCMLERAVVPILGSRKEAEAFLAEASGRIWLIAEVQKLERLGLPSGVREEFAEVRPLGRALVLLRRDAPRAVPGSDQLSRADS